MLQIKIDGVEMFDEQTNAFVTIKPTILNLEHSLIAMAKWESKWHKPFLSNNHTSEEVLDYIRCMSIKPVDIDTIKALSKEQIDMITEYIDDPMTATTFRDNRSSSQSQFITNELIYYYMTANNIPFECEKWHINRLLTLIRVCSIKNSPSKKMSKHDILARNKALNAERLKRYNTNG